MKNRRPNRLSEFDYSTPGYYFITICVKEFKPLFGRIRNEEILLNEVGKIASKNWKNIPMHFDSCEIDEFIVMPNHIHGIIVLTELGINENFFNVESRFVNQSVGTRHALSLRRNNYLSKVVGSYKSSISKEAHDFGYEFTWQRSFYDHIIRNEKDLYSVRKYIKQNPLKWELDKYNK